MSKKKELRPVPDYRKANGAIVPPTKYPNIADAEGGEHAGRTDWFKWAILTHVEGVLFYYDIAAKDVIERVTDWDAFQRCMILPVLDLAFLVKSSYPSKITLDHPIGGIEKEMPEFSVELKYEKRQRVFTIDIGVSKLGIRHSRVLLLDEFDSVHAPAISFISIIMEKMVDTFERSLVQKSFKDAADAFIAKEQAQIDKYVK